MYNKDIILQGPHYPETKFLLLPTSNMDCEINLIVTTKGDNYQIKVTTKGEDSQQFCHNAYQQKTSKELLRYLHAVAFSPAT